MRFCYLLPLCLALLAMGCNKRLKNGQTALKPSILVADKTITFPLDSVTGYWPKDLSMYTTPEGREQLVMLSESETYVQFFDIQTRQRTRKIRIPSEVPPDTKACYAVSEDSIFISTHTSCSLTLINGKGQITNQYVDTLTRSAIEKAWGNRDFIPKIGCPIIPHDHSIHRQGDYLYLVNTAGWNEYKVGVYDSGYMASRWNIHNGEVTYIKRCPEVMHGKRWANDTFNVAYHPGKRLLVYGHSSLSLLETYDPERNDAREYWIHNRVFDSIPPFMQDPDRSEYEMLDDQRKQQFDYDALVYDPYRQVYYYFILHPFRIDIDSWDWDNTMARRFSILVLDENFKPLGEHALPDKQYTWYNFFVCRDGFYISNAHPDNPLLKKGEMTFTRLSLNRKAL